MPCYEHFLSSLCIDCVSICTDFYLARWLYNECTLTAFSEVVFARIPYLGGTFSKHSCRQIDWNGEKCTISAEQRKQLILCEISLVKKRHKKVKKWHKVPHYIWDALNHFAGCNLTAKKNSCWKWPFGVSMNLFKNKHITLFQKCGGWDRFG